MKQYDIIKRPILSEKSYIQIGPQSIKGLELKK